jgi:hypothetical protein
MLLQAAALELSSHLSFLAAAAQLSYSLLLFLAAAQLSYSLLLLLAAAQLSYSLLLFLVAAARQLSSSLLLSPSMLLSLVAGEQLSPSQLLSLAEQRHHRHPLPLHHLPLHVPLRPPQLPLPHGPPPPTHRRYRHPRTHRSHRRPRDHTLLSDSSQCQHCRHRVSQALSACSSSGRLPRWRQHRPTTRRPSSKRRDQTLCKFRTSSTIHLHCDASTPRGTPRARCGCMVMPVLRRRSTMASSKRSKRPHLPCFQDASEVG